MNYNRGMTMKFILQGGAQTHPEIIGLLTEDKLIDLNKTNELLNLKNLEVEKVEFDGTQKVVYIKETTKTNLLQE